MNSNGLKYHSIVTLFLVIVVKAFTQNVTIPPDQTNSTPDSALSPGQVYKYIRGIEKDEHLGFSPWYSLKQTVLFVPNQFFKGIKFASGYGVEFFDDPKFITDLEGVFFNNDRTLGWYPIVDITSEQRPRVGLNLLAKKAPFQTLIKGRYADDQKFKTEARFAFFRQHDNRTLRFNLILLYEYDDDRKFYGFGADPRNDNRNRFLSTSGSDHGIYFQQHGGVRYIAGYKPHSQVSYYFTSSWDRRHIQAAIEDQDRLSNIMDTRYIPGMNNKYDQWYNEIALRYNNRNNNRYLSSGTSIEVYAGLDRGLRGTRYSSIKSGIDMYTRNPVLLKNRVITSRLVINTMHIKDDHTPVPFTAFPEHTTFRGVNSRTLLRTDQIIMTPSLQYSWPLSFNLGAHLFMDYLIAGQNWDRISTHNSPWAAGFILDFHSLHEELANGKIIYGSEGWRFHIDIGVSIY